jgi:dihydroorotate dehydrogenase (fumarate)
MPNLKTRYLGLDLRNPVVASPSPLCENVDNIRGMEDAGAAAVVLQSLFEEQIEHASLEIDAHLSHGADVYAESLSYFPELSDYNAGPDGYLEHVAAAKAAVDIPVIGSLNGVSTGGWTEYAKGIEQAGADALELNTYFLPTDPAMSAVDVEKMYTDLVREVRATITIPVAVKIGPYFSALVHAVRQLEDAGANGLVLFNRFYQPDLDIETLDVKPDLNLSAPYELRLRLRWAAILFSQLNADMAITGGVHDAVGVLKSMMAGARVAMMTSALLLHGISHIGSVLRDLERWMEEHEYESIEQMQGSMSQRAVEDPAAFERANYLKVLSSYGRLHNGAR